MIRKCKIHITDLNSYEKLSKYVDPIYMDSSVVTFLKEHIGLSCKLVAVEYPYYEKDYLSCYYIFYAKKLQEFPKDCYRLLFYSDSIGHDLMGYITLRPTYTGRHIDRMFFDPKYVVKSRMNLILAKCKCHVDGDETEFPFFPHLQQDGDVTVCAHIATYSVLRCFALRFHQYPDLCLGQVVEMITTQSERSIPSKGLSAYQISKIFLDVGFSSIVLNRTSRKGNLLKDAIVSYIESGIPVVAVISNREHAVSVVGIGRYYQDDWDLEKQIRDVEPFEMLNQDGKETQTNVVLSSRFVESLIVNDDTTFPYQAIHMVKPPEDSTGLPTYSITEIDRIIVPLYSRVQLAYDDVRIISLRMIDATKQNWPSLSVVRIFLASSNTFREYINHDCKSLDKIVRSIFVKLPMPKFIWCVEISEPGHYKEGYIDGMILIDSTSATVNPDPGLLIFDNTGALRYKDGPKVLEYISTPMRELQVPRFSHNLKEVY